MNITYTRNGDYLIPNIIIRKTKPLGHYGRLRKAYLEMHRPILFNELALFDKLFEHCAEIDEAARNRMELIVPELAKRNGSSLIILNLQQTGLDGIADLVVNRPIGETLGAVVGVD